jgi:nitroreductase
MREAVGPRKGRVLGDEHPPLPRWYNGRVSDHRSRSRLETAGLADAVYGRSSIRKYAAEAVPREDVEAMVGLAVRSANAGNAQPWRFVAVEDAVTCAAMKDAVDAAIDVMAAWPEAEGREKELESYRAYATFFADAPLVVAVFGVPYRSVADVLLHKHNVPGEERDRLRQRPDIQSIGGAVQLLCTAAHAMGYGACWMTAPVLAAPAIEGLLGVEPPARLVAVVPVGRPLTMPRPTSRRPLSDVLEFC